MKRFREYIVFTFVVLLGFISCQQKDLFPHETDGKNYPANVVIHWDSVPANQLVLPSRMTVHWYPDAGSIISSEMGAHGGREWLYGTNYNVMCMDFNGNSNLAFRSNGTRPDFEVYNIRMTGSYNLSVPQLPEGETTVAEANPPYFYIDSRSQDIHVEDFLDNDDALTVHFYPKNGLREFTFLIYDVTGTKNIASNSGAISGMSGSYYPSTGALATTPSTILFPRVETITDAQNSSRWTDEEKALFAAKNPDWASPDTLIGWTRDWVTGRFSTFGPLNCDENRFRLTIEAFSKGSNAYYGAWGYWHGQWENTVAAQIDSAMGKKGTFEEQLAWRQRNGGYDIVLYNNNRLSVPENDGGGGRTDGGFNVSVSDWGDIIDVPLAGSSKTTSAGVALRSKVNTVENISDFVVSGIWQSGGNWDRLFNAQNVYKPEDPSKVWDYSPKKYWPQGGDVDFYAYAPAGITNLREGLYDDSNTLTLPPVLTYAMPLKNGRETPPPGTGEPNPTPVVEELQEDLLVAVQNRTSPQPQGVAVPMNFQHAFSRVSVKAKLHTDDFTDGYRIKVTRVDLRNLKTKGDLKLKKDEGTAFSDGIPSGEVGFTKFKYNGTNKVTLWTNLDSIANHRFKLLSTAVITTDDYTSLVHSDDGVFVMPQEIAGNNAAVYVEYDIYIYSPIGGEQYVSSTTKLFALDTGFAFEIGRSYALLLELRVE